MKTDVTLPKAFGVWFSELGRWSVGSLVEIGWTWSTDDIKPLSNVLQRKFNEVDQAHVDIRSIRLVTLHFDGEMELRLKERKSAIKGKLWWADPGDVIYSKIDVRNGAIGIVPDQLGRVCVTSEYPIYSVYQSKTDAKYIKLLFRTGVFRQKINSMISGASGRKRVQPSMLESLEVPVPSLPVQKTRVKS